MALPPKEWWTNWDNQKVVDNSYGAFLGGHTVQEAFYNTMQEWLPSYVAEFNRQLGSKVLVPPFEYRHRPDFRALPRNVGAAIMVEVPHTAGAPRIYQNGIRANWRVEVFIYVYGTKDWQETQALTYAYAACVRACMIQHRGLGGVAETTIWEGEQYREGEHHSTRTTGMAHLRFIVTLGNVMNMYGGAPSPQYAPEGAITGPSTQPATPVPVVDEVTVTVEKEPQ